MNIKELNSKLKDKAISLGLCEKWQQKWDEDSSQQVLINKYFKGVDFSLKHHYPSNEFIKNFFDKDLLRKNGILVDDNRSLLNPEEAMILGSSKAIIRVNGRHHSIIYVRDNSFVKIFVKNNSFTIIHLFENANIDVEVQDSPDLLVLKNSKNVVITANKTIRIKDDFSYLK